MEKRIEFLKVNFTKEVIELLEEYDRFLNPNISSRVFSLETYAEKLCMYGEIICINIDKQRQGFIAYYINDEINKITFLTQIATKPNSPKGTGSSLMNYYINDALNKKMKQIKLEVFKENTKAIDFYKMFNFDLVGENGDFFIMSKKLT